ncbi:MAG: hypothetical protein A2283_16250 [Lentisphaerae bacterium RIFOXYA12_FULL_48_11]|nr:MAG: hypothetical protein A2283_16250 [Lentisphaerae bacterium RIFOXYA12_FULL_48_11]
MDSRAVSLFKAAITAGFDSGQSRNTAFRVFILLLVICVSLVVTILFSYVAFFQQAELGVLDLRFKHRPVPVTSDRLGTVDIDSAAIDRVGGWPVSRKVYADIIRCLHRYDVSLVTFDIFFSDPGALTISPDQMKKVVSLAEQGDKTDDLMRIRSSLRESPDEDFAAALNITGSSILAQSFKFAKPEIFPDLEKIERLTKSSLENADERFKKAIAMADNFSIPYAARSGPEVGLARAFSVEPPDPALLKHAAGLGFAQIVQDIDGSARKYPLFILYNGRFYPSIGLMGVSILTKVSLSEMTIVPGSHVVLPNASIIDGHGNEVRTDIRIPVDRYLRMTVNWTGDYMDTFHHVPASAVMSFQADSLIRECLHAYGNRKNDIIEKGYEEAVQRVVNRGLMREEDAGLIAMKLMMAQLAESAQTSRSVSRDVFLQDFGSDTSEMRSMVAGIWDQVADNAKILDLIRKNPEVSELEIVKKLNIENGRREEMHHAVNYLRFIVKRRKDVEKWRPLYFFKPVEVSYEGSSRKTVLSPLDLADRVLYLGLTASGTHDYGPMPFNTGYPMVGLHVNAVNTILTRQFIRELPWWGILLVAMTCALPVAYFTHRLHPLAGSGFMIVVCAGYFWLGAIAFNKAGVWLPTIPPVVSVAGTFLAIVVRNVLLERHEKRKLRNAFSTYVTPSIVKRVMEDPNMLKLGGQRRTMTAFFSDVAGFTAISEESTPEALVAMLNDYLDAMTGIIFKHEGTLDKYQGDGIMAFWNAPVDQENHAYRACCAAIDSINCIRNDLHPRWKAEGKPLLSIRIGVNTGAMIVGNMGSRTRMNYTVMGDPVNLASRLESANKEYGTRVMISEFVMEHVNDSLVVRELDILRVKGKLKPVRVYEVLAKAGEVDEGMLSLLDAYNEGLKLYRAGCWKDAESAFASAIKICKDDGPSNMYFRRCREFVNAPPKPGWDGVWILTSK